MQKRVVVIGGGAGGYSAALYCAKLGMQVALVERRPFFGGTCLNEGCIPTKAYVQAATVYSHIREAGRYGIHLTDTGIVNWADTLRFKRKVVKQLQNGVKHHLRHANVELIRGKGELLNNKQVKVVTETEEKILDADAVILATGSREIEIPGFETDGVTILNSTQMLDLDALPDSLIIIGGGVIGVEFASILNRMQKKVTIVELSPHIIPTEDTEISELLRQSLTMQGVDILTETQAEALCEKDESHVTIRVRGKDRQEQLLTADKLLICVGRTANLDEIGLESVGLPQIRKRLQTDAHMQTDVEGIYAVGDITLSPQLAHVAYHEAKVAAQTIAGKAICADYHAIPGCIFSHPEVARVGMTEEEARKDPNQVVSVETTTFVGNGKAMIEGENAGIIKLVMVGEEKKLVGISIIGPKATELIAEPGLAVTLGLPVQVVADTIHAHPSLSEIIGEVAGAAAGLGLHS